MKAIESYRNEHHSLLKVTAKVQEVVDKGISGNPKHLPLLMNYLDTLLNGILLHVVVEDGYFYPQVQALGDADLSTQVLRIREEARGLEEGVRAFQASWSAPRVSREFTGFSRELLQLIDVLLHRVEAEERIFTLLEKRGGKGDGLIYRASGVDEMARRSGAG